MSPKRIKFGMKYKGHLHKLLTLSLAKDGIIVSDAITPLHDYYPKDGSLHTTQDAENEEDKKKIYWAKIPPIDELDKPILIAENWIESSPYDSLPNYEIIDVDAFECEMPIVKVYVARPNSDKINEIRQAYRGEKRVVEFPNVWVVLLFMDARQPIR